jgi:hypothetical protein
MVSLKIHTQQPSYPRLCSGRAILKNVNHLEKTITLGFRKEGFILMEGAGEGLEVIMDTGAMGTLFPKFIADLLDLKEQPPESDGWAIFHGVGGIGVYYYPQDSVEFTIEDDDGKSVQEIIKPAVYISYAPSFSATGKHLQIEGRRRFPKSIVDFVKLQHRITGGGYTAKVWSPFFPCPILGGKQQITVNISKEIPMLIGRDWQEKFRLEFSKEILTIR